MKFTLYVLSILILTSCATSSFQQRKHLSGKFKAPKGALSSAKSTNEKNNNFVFNDVVEVKKAITNDQTQTKKEVVSIASQTKKEKKTKTNENTSKINEINTFNTKALFLAKNSYTEPSFDDTVYIEQNSIESESANKSKGQGTASLILGILSFFPIPLTTLIFSIISISLAKSSLSTRYQTEIGRRNAKIGKILSTISLSLLIAAILLVITLLFVFGF